MIKPTFRSLVPPALALVATALISSCTLIAPYAAADRDDTDSPIAREEPTRPPSDDPASPDDEERAAEPRDSDRGDRAARGEITEAPPEGEPWRTLAEGQQSAVRVPLARAITTRDAWMDVWAALTANQNTPPERPAVDFDEETVVVLLLGERRTGGYSVGIADVTIDRARVEVEIRVTRPAPGEMVTQALTSPWYVATVPGSGREIRFTGDDVARGFEGD